MYFHAVNIHNLGMRLWPSGLWHCSDVVGYHCFRRSCYLNLQGEVNGAGKGNNPPSTSRTAFFTGLFATAAAWSSMPPHSPPTTSFTIFHHFLQSSMRSTHCYTPYFHAPFPSPILFALKMEAEGLPNHCYPNISLTQCHKTRRPQHESVSLWKSQDSYQFRKHQSIPNDTNLVKWTQNGNTTWFKMYDTYPPDTKQWLNHSVTWNVTYKYTFNEKSNNVDICI
jgi:hypothetical protein